MPEFERGRGRSLRPGGTGLILGIESSCDETAGAVVWRGRETLSNVVASQIALHANYGGVVPELASREHLRNIVPVVRSAVAEAGVTLRELEAVAVTQGPGLAGALLVGVTYAKALAMGLDKPLIGVNHLEGHIHAVLMECGTRFDGAGSGEAPLLALVVSGGHTHLYLAWEESGIWRYRNVGRTVDDAAGEAFDKVAKLLGLGYPGGPWMDRLAGFGDPRSVPFHFSPIRTRGEPRGEGAPEFLFSFSGIKTAVLRYIQAHGMGEAAERRRPVTHGLRPATEVLSPLVADGTLDQQTLNLAASFQYAVVGILLKQTFRAAGTFGVRGLLVSGGVAANSELRRRFTAEADVRGLPIAFPSAALATDNAVMIAAAAWPLLVSGEVAAEGISATPELRLG